jgi:hypothetical protein
VITDFAYVPLRGQRSAAGPLTWGQRAIWTAARDMAPCDHYLNHGRVLAVPRGAGAVSVSQALAALAALIDRHEALRSRISGPDEHPGQEVSRVGLVPTAVVATSRGDAPAVARRLVDHLAATRFDYRAGWPVRPGLVVVDGRVSRVVLVFCHLAADGWGAELVLRDLRLLLRGREPAPVAGQPLDLAAAQCSAAGRRVSERALEHWVDAHRRMSPLALPQPDVAPAEWPYQRALLHSPATDAAARVVAARLRTTSATVLLTAVTALLATLTGQPVCGIRPIVDNRFHDGYGAVVSTVNQEGIVLLEPAGGTFDALVAQMRRVSLRAYRQARFDPAAVSRAVATAGRARTGDVRSFGCFNDQRLRRDDTVPPPDVAEVRALLPQTTLTWPFALPHLNCEFCVHLGGEAGVGGLALTADTRRVPAADMEWFLRSVEALVVGSASEPVPVPVPVRARAVERRRQMVAEGPVER